MTIDLKWLLPFIMPFVLLGYFRVLWLLVWATWDSDVAVVLSIIIGSTLGLAIAGAMAIDDVKWNIRIGGKE